MIPSIKLKLPQYEKLLSEMERKKRGLKSLLSKIQVYYGEFIFRVNLEN